MHTLINALPKSLAFFAIFESVSVEPREGSIPLTIAGETVNAVPAKPLRIIWNRTLNNDGNVELTSFITEDASEGKTLLSGLMNETLQQAPLLVISDHVAAHLLKEVKTCGTVEFSHEEYASCINEAVEFSVNQFASF